MVDILTLNVAVLAAFLVFVQLIEGSRSAVVTDFYEYIQTRMQINHFAPKHSPWKRARLKSKAKLINNVKSIEKELDTALNQPTDPKLTEGSIILVTIKIFIAIYFYFF